MQHFMKGTSKPSFSPCLSSPCFLSHRCKLQFSPRGSRKCYTLCWCACSQYTRRGFIVFMYGISERMRGCLPVMCVCVHVMERCRRVIVLWFCFFWGGEVLSYIHIKEEGGVESVLALDLKKEKCHLETEHWASVNVCVCVWVYMCVCWGASAQYPCILPTPGTVVHPTRCTVALFITETRSVCVCDRRKLCANVAYILARLWVILLA